MLKTISGLRLADLALALQTSRPASSRVVVVEMHETPSARADQFRRQLDWVAKHFALIGPESFARALETKTAGWPESKPAVLFTFDDGRESNYLIAAPILESFGARGIFFVVPQFIGLQGNAAKEFYYSRIDRRNLPPADPEDNEIWKPMKPEQLADLVRRGHWIGNHTLSHASLTGPSASELQREIEESSRQIASWTGRPVESFAWAYSWNAIDRASIEAVKKEHRFCFAPCPGTVEVARDSRWLIWRREIESYYSPFEYQFMYSGLVDPFWARRRRELRKMFGQAH